MRDLESEPLRDRASLSIEGPVLVACCPKGARSRRLNDEIDVRIRRSERQYPFPGTAERHLALRHVEYLGPAHRSDAIDPFSSLHHADAEGAFVGRHFFNDNDLPCHLAYG